MSRRGLRTLFVLHTRNLASDRLRCEPPPQIKAVSPSWMMRITKKNCSLFSSTESKPSSSSAPRREGRVEEESGGFPARVMMDLTASKRRPTPPDNGCFSADALGERRGGGGGGGEGSSTPGGVQVSFSASPPHHRPLCLPESSPVFVGRVPAASPLHSGIHASSPTAASTSSGGADSVIAALLTPAQSGLAVSPSSLLADRGGRAPPSSHTRPLLQELRGRSSPPFPGHVPWLSTAASPVRHTLPSPSNGEGMGALNGVSTATDNRLASFITPVKRSDSTASPAASLR